MWGRATRPCDTDLVNLFLGTGTVRRPKREGLRGMGELVKCLRDVVSEPPVRHLLYSLPLGGFYPPMGLVILGIVASLLRGRKPKHFISP